MLIIGISGETLKHSTGLSNENIVYLVVFFVALSYSHWCLYWFISPLQHMAKEQRLLIKRLSHNSYKKGFFAGTVGLGYFLAFL